MIAAWGRRHQISRLPIGTAGLTAFVLIGAALGLRLYLIPIWPTLNSDEGTFGLMARHIAYDGALPTYMYGQNYMGAIEAYLGAVAFHLFGDSTVSLRLGMILLYGVFLGSLYRLASQLYGKAVALLSLVLLVPASKEVFAHQLAAVGGAMETLVFGTLALLIATYLVLSAQEGGAVSPGRLAAWFAWGLTAGLGLWSHVLVVPWLIFSFGLLAVFCRNELRTRAMAGLLLGLVVGLSPVILHDISTRQSSIATVLSNYKQGGTGTVLGQPDIGRQIAGTFLVTLPLATGAENLCALPWQEWWPLSGGSSPHTITCTVVHGAWSAGIVGIWGMAVWLTLLPLIRLRRLRSRAPPDRQAMVLTVARLVMLTGAGATVVLYALSPAAVTEPRPTSRYLVGVAIALPALVAVLVGPHPARLRWPAWRLAPWSALVFVLAVLISGTQEVMSAELQYASWLDWRQNAQVADLLQRGIARIYTDYWTCERIAFQSDERILCAVLDDRLQPGQDRYLPYRTEVLAAGNASYVFPDPSPQASILDRRLKQSRQRYRRMEAYGYVIYEPVSIQAIWPGSCCTVTGSHVQKLGGSIMSRYRHGVLATAAALALLIPAGTAHADARSATASIALHLSDFPSGYKKVLAQYHTNAQLAQQPGMSLAILTAKGRLIGYDTAFQHPGKTSSSYTLVEDTVSAYKATSGAKWGYDTNVAKLSPKTSGYTPLKLSTVGVKSSAFSLLAKVGSGQRIDVILFYDRTYSVAVQIEGPKGTVPKADLLHYAQVIDGRIKGM